MATRNVVLTQGDKVVAERLLESGRYQSLGEVVRAGLRLLEERESELDEIHVRLASEAAQASARARVRSEAAIRGSLGSGRPACLE